MRKYVIAGGPGCGKTEVVNALAEKDYCIIPEAALQLIEEENACGGCVYPWTKPIEFEERVYKRQLKQELDIPWNADVVIFDTALPTCVAYYGLKNISVPEELTGLISELYYEAAFCLEILPEEIWHKTRSGLPRHGTYDDARKLCSLIRQAYESIGVKITDVPFMSVSERVALIEKYLVEV